MELTITKVTSRKTELKSCSFSVRRQLEKCLLALLSKEATRTLLILFV